MKNFEEFVKTARASSFFKQKVSALFVSDNDPDVLFFTAKEGYSSEDLDAFWDEVDPNVEFAEFSVADADLADAGVVLKEIQS